MKLYDLLSPAVIAAICDEAHNLGMSVTGHLPRALSVTAAVDSGMDQFAHLPIRGDAQSDSTKAVIAYLRAHGTVIDPTESWNEIGGHSRDESVQTFQPVLQHLPPPFVQFRVANWGSANTDPATAHSRLDRSLQTIRALHDAGVPIVAGTDEGIPGFSVYREMELYVKAGFHADGRAARSDVSLCQGARAGERSRDDRARQARRSPCARQEPARRHLEHPHVALRDEGWPAVRELRASGRWRASLHSERAIQSARSAAFGSARAARRCGHGARDDGATTISVNATTVYTNGSRAD